MAPQVCDQKAANLWTARIIPAILIGIVGYVTWVIVALVCVDYLLKPPVSSHSPRPGAAIVILLFYFLLLLFVAIAYFRILQTIVINPGYVARGPAWFKKQRSFKSEMKTRKGKRIPIEKALDEKTELPVGKDAGEDGSPAHIYPAGPTTTDENGLDDDVPGLEEFYNKDVFVCESDGRPIWCSTCLTWKPDRTHHCREVGRCVRKMDHFCPWVGGIVSETNFKFFVQFVSWSAVMCLFCLIFMAVFIAERCREANYHANVNWILTLAFGALFFLFTFGMSLSSLQFVFVNTTTIENLNRHTKVWTLAVHLSKLPANPTFRTVTYPLTNGPSFSGTNNAVSSPLNPPRTFAILHSKPGENPWDLGRFGNFKQVMGENWWDWILPLKYSPYCNHDKGESAFALGPVVDRMREDAGIETLKRRKRRKSRSGTVTDDPRVGDRTAGKMRRQREQRLVQREIREGESRDGSNDGGREI